MNYFIYLAGIGSALFSWFCKAKLGKPWGTFLDMEKVSYNKKDRYFITVKHYHWLPPFSSYQMTYLSSMEKYDSF